MPPAFSVDFVTYYQAREKLMPELRRKTAVLRTNAGTLKTRQTERQNRYDAVSSRSDAHLFASTYTDCFAIIWDRFKFECQ